MEGRLWKVLEKVLEKVPKDMEAFGRSWKVLKKVPEDYRSF